jgi:guanosine-3',5'-bis(diphosphate) 3'-pyrophosphohydrolase
MVQKAIEQATVLHRGQFRDGEDPLPYATHPIEVLINLRNVGGVTDDDLLCAAALHDTVEEGVTTFENIESDFGPRVRSLVQELTRREPGPDETKGLDEDQIWSLRAGILLDEIRRMSAEAQSIKLADRLANVKDAKRVKKGKKLERYLRQSREILKVVPESVNPGLWNALRTELS